MLCSIGKSYNGSIVRWAQQGGHLHVLPTQKLREVERAGSAGLETHWLGIFLQRAEAGKAPLLFD